MKEQIDSSRTEELGLFFITTAIVAPLLTVMIVAGYGFTVWISQLLMGPPGV
ncbi:nitrate reductase NapE [Sinobacterium caligoides]|uniref:Nitrate reductase NapE n=1 Tax=Sinobacterium caligoides TaxID=933926 RepID=A0A3N2DP22_9GAMM|nr:periplasmic nitrate reductase, NapE protein [Sinobacterium caligoides]ROS01558.1 nitrate reductase NapE [Sinobacterium caligoides]